MKDNILCKCKEKMIFIDNDLNFQETTYWCPNCGRLFVENADEGNEWLEPKVIKVMEDNFLL